ncbi:hypothetical protein [Streptomyces sp. NPDC007346]|uniref:hypothetical protein n=1 Tax=Streptomyces sp. NPDC007346 TaxID=3154682 RepID=UPI0034560503
MKKRAGIPLRRVGRSLALALAAVVLVACGDESPGADAAADAPGATVASEATVAAVTQDMVDAAAEAGLVQMGEPVSEKDCAVGITAQRQAVEGEEDGGVAGALGDKGWAGEETHSIDGLKETLLTKQGWELRVRSYSGEGEAAGLVALIASRSGCELP